MNKSTIKEHPQCDHKSCTNDADYEGYATIERDPFGRSLGMQPLPITQWIRACEEHKMILNGFRAGDTPENAKENKVC